MFATIGYAVQVKVHHTGHQKVSNRLRHCELMIVWVSGYQICYFWRERRGGGGEVVVSCPDYFASSMKKVFNGRGIMYIVLMASFHEGKETHSEKALKKYDDVHMTLPPDSNLV